MTDSPIMVGDGPEAVMKRDFRLARSEAIQAYAYLEQSLCGLFAHLAGVTDQIAGVIFFKMTNARSRIATLERLKRIKHGSARGLYFNSITAALGPLDTERNHLVHWHERFQWKRNSVTGDQSIASFLDPPNYWDQTDNTPRMGLQEIQVFIERCNAIGGSAFSLTYDWQGPPLDPPWPDIFEQPVSYPLPEGHPIGQTQQEPEHRPQP